MKKISAVVLSLALGLISMAMVPTFASAHGGDTRKELAAVRVPINQSRHIEFQVPARGGATTANSSDYYTLDVSNSSPGPMAPDSGGYLDGVCSGVIKGYVSGVMIWQLNLITRFQYDNFQSVRRVSLSSTARGYGNWYAGSQSFNWGSSGHSWLTSYVDADFTNETNYWAASIDEEADSEGTCDVFHN